MKRAKALILDLSSTSPLSNDLRGILESSPDLAKKLRFKSHKPDKAFQYKKALSGTISRFNPDVAFFVLSSNHLKLTAKLVQDLRRQKTLLPVVAVIENGKTDDMLELLEAGLDDFINSPLKRANVIPRVWRLLEQANRRQTLNYKVKEQLGLKQILGQSREILSVTGKIRLVAKCDATVLISGETGTGKELCARAIHYLGLRADKPFVPVDCGAIPLELVENELFGHVAGAFTGASSPQSGLIKEADGGTLFLDDIDCLPLSAQVKLLRLLQEKEYRLLGSVKVRRANVRIIVATNRNLEEAVLKGQFRKDLYYRLNIILIPLPSLRQRREDIPILAHHFLEKYAAEFNKGIDGLAPDALQKLALYDWPGNVRELEHVIERAVVLSEQPMIRESDIALTNPKSADVQESFKEAKEKAVTRFEKSYIQGLLTVHRGNISHAARAAQKNRRAFWQLIRKHGINARSFKPQQFRSN